jgi:SAM-dependent methyltransferase
MNNSPLLYRTWHADAEREAAMENGHRPFWRHFIGLITETDLSTHRVLDFGCNRGGFLRLLYDLRPFQQGLGIDIAQDSIAAARGLSGLAPVEYEVASDLSAWLDCFDIAFSYEVIYLLPDIAAHAAGMYAALRDSGVYYAVTGCHTDSPIWPEFRGTIAQTTNAPVQDRAPDDYAAAFAKAGFQVSVRRFGYDGFIPAPKDRSYYPKLMDAVDYAAEYKLLFRFVKDG